MDRDATTTMILAFLRDELRIREELDADTELVSTGIVDSADLLRVATHLERELDVTIPDADIELDNFDSVRRMLAYLESLSA